MQREANVCVLRVINGYINIDSPETLPGYMCFCWLCMKVNVDILRDLCVCV